MKATFLLGVCYLLIIPFAIHAQIQKEPASYSKIKIVYEMHPNIDYNEREIYADTMLLKRILPSVKFRKIKSPTDPDEIIGAVTIQLLTKDEKQSFANHLFYSTQLIKIAYTPKKNKTVIYQIAGYDRKELFRLNTLFETNYIRRRFLSNIIRYKENFEYTRRVAGYRSKGNIQDNQVKWLEDRPNMGTYVESGHGMKYTNLIYTNAALNKNISPLKRFGNCELGIEKIVSYYYTQDLLSVTYL